ncbi:MAG: helix-turn-helix transcriptional regulator [Lacunisphaera sp.]
MCSAGNPLRESNALPEHADELLLRLTPAERLVAIHVGHGLSNKEISSVLQRAEPTIKHQLASVHRKLGVQGRCQLIVLLLSGRRSFLRG